MNKVNQILLVDNDLRANSERLNLIKESGLSEQVKVTVNGGHALLYLDHISHTLNNDSRMVILLNMETPIANGFDFLNGYRTYNGINKKNILIIVMQDNLCTEKIEKTKGLGISNFINSAFSIEHLHQLVENHFHTGSSPVTEQQQQQQQQQASSIQKNKRKKTTTQSGFNISL